MYNIEISPTALKFLEHLQTNNRNIVRRVINAIDSLKTNPFLGKKLLGDLSAFRSLRVGEYRILYTIIKREILIQVVKIAHRREVYR
ncbi:MAG: type II toxin-antitoxin system RelE/ParE family toxin [Candidatus Omnitrophica bacterium]|nr:type II toxin-antitoxin system RelE/ParE family toxin [Candidatus Omnitrophota bacterium]